MHTELPKSAAETLRVIAPRADGFFTQAKVIVDRKGRCKRTWAFAELHGQHGIDSWLANFDGTGSLMVNLGLSAVPVDRHFHKEDVTHLPAFFLDLDTGKPGCPDTADILVEFLQTALPIPPTLINASGSGGVHVFYAFETPVPVVAGGDVEIIWKALEAHVKRLAAEKHGWTGFDSVTDLARTVRVPFSKNPKPGSGRCLPLACTRRYYTLDEIVSVIPEQDIEQVLNTMSRTRSKHRPAGAVAGVHVDAVESNLGADVNMMLDGFLEAAEEEWIKRINKKNAKDADQDEVVPANLRAVHQGCGFIRHCVTSASTLSEPQWHAAVGIWKQGLYGDDVARAASGPYPGNTAEETDAKLAAAKAPASCHHIVGLGFKGCEGCYFRDRIDSPIELGTRTADHVRLLENFIYVKSTDEIVEHRVVGRMAFDAPRFNRAHAELTLLGRPSQVFLGDTMATKVRARAYDPGQPPGPFVAEDGQLYLNFYEPPCHGGGDGRPDKFFDHLHYLIPDAQERDVVTKWFASMVQHPERKLGYSVALIGGQGTGKSYLLEVMKRVLGPSNVNSAQGSNLFSQFKWHMAGKVLLGVEEVSIKGHGETYENMKALVTNETDKFEKKGKDPEMLDTPRGVLLLSNDPYALHLPSDDRRFFVVDTAPAQHSGGAAYYTELFDLSPAFVASVYDALKSIDLTGFNFHRPPFETSAKQRMISYSRADIDVIVGEWFQDEVGPFAHDIATWDELVSFIRSKCPLEAGLTNKRIRRALAAVGVTKDPQDRQPRTANGRLRLWFVRNASAYCRLTPAELGDAYSQQTIKTDVQCVRSVANER